MFDLAVGGSGLALILPDSWGFAGLQGWGRAGGTFDDCLAGVLTADYL